MAEDPTDVQGFVAAWEVAWNSRQADTMAGLFAERGDLLVGPGPRIEGRPAIRDWWLEYFSKLDRAGRSRYSIDSIQPISSEVALLNVHTRVSGPGVQPVEERGTWVLRRERGRWRIAAMRGQLPVNDKGEPAPGPRRAPAKLHARV